MSDSTKIFHQGLFLFAVSITAATLYLLHNVGMPCIFRDTAVNDESMATVLFTNLLSQLERVRSQEQNFLQRHNMKIIQQQLQVCHLPSIPSCLVYVPLITVFSAEFSNTLIGAL